MQTEFEKTGFKDVEKGVRIIKYFPNFWLHLISEYAPAATVYSRSLVHLHIVSMLCKLDKTSWTCSMLCRHSGKKTMLLIEKNM